MDALICKLQKSTLEDSSSLHEISHSIKLESMIRKALTYLTILAITALPVQLISASAEVVIMQMSMGQQMQTSNECLHEMDTEAEAVTTAIEKSCCDESHDCQNCNNCPQAVSVLFLPAHAQVKMSLLKATKFSIGHSVLNGIPQNNLLRPPRNLI